MADPGHVLVHVQLTAGVKKSVPLMLLLLVLDKLGILGASSRRRAVASHHTSADMFGKGGRKGGARDSTHAAVAVGGRGKEVGAAAVGVAPADSNRCRIGLHTRRASGSVAALAVSHARSQLFSGSGDGTVKIWDWSAGFKSAHA